MDSKAHHTHHEEVYNQPQKKRGGIKNHCKKLWWCWLLVTIVVILVVLLPIIYVAIPNKAQSDINASTLEVTNEEVTNPTADSVSLKIDTLIKSSSPFHPNLDGFRAGLSLQGKPAFFYVDVPASKAEAETKVTVQQVAKIANMDAFVDYTKTVVASENFQVHMDGKTTLHLSGLPSMKVNYNKVITMKGLNGLKGLNITNPKLLTGDKVLPDGTNLIATTNINNPSVMTLDLGDVTMNLAVDGAPIGTSVIKNMVLLPGRVNSFNVSSNTDVSAIMKLVAKYPTLVLPVDITGNSSVKNGVHLTYYEEALKSAPVRVELDAKQALAGSLTS